MTIRIALVGAGKIAREQHLPAITSDRRFTLAASADPARTLPGVPAFPSLDHLLDEGFAIDAVSICTPPRDRGPIVARALDAGLHVLIEKPPAATLAQVEAMRTHALAAERTLYAAWHSREAGGVAPARAWLAGRQVTGFHIDWREDVRQWHPGQDWLFTPSGFGVFDPGINALSIATDLLPGDLFVSEVRLAIPRNRQAPINARLAMSGPGYDGTATFDFLEKKRQRWIIKVMTSSGELLLDDGGKTLVVEGERRHYEDTEYAGVYNRFAGLIAAQTSDVDDRPLRIVADANLVAVREYVEPFQW